MFHWVSTANCFTSKFKHEPPLSGGGGERKKKEALKAFSYHQ